MRRRAQWSASRRRWVGTQKVVVGRSAGRCATRSVTTAGSKRPGTSSRPPASRVAIAKRRGAEWCSGPMTRCTSSSANPQRSRSSATSAAAAASSSSPDQTALGRPVVPEVRWSGRARGVPRSGRRAARAATCSASSTATGSVTSSATVELARGSGWGPAGRVSLLESGARAPRRRTPGNRVLGARHVIRAQGSTGPSRQHRRRQPVGSQHRSTDLRNALTRSDQRL